MLRYGSLFAGAGLLDLGLHEILPDLDCRYAIEIDDDRRRIFGAHNPSTKLFGDITTCQPANLPNIDGLIGGVPCNTHSTTNTAGTRGLAPQWQHARRIIETQQPTWTVWESSGKGKSWTHWVPAVRRDLWGLGHASMCVRLRTRHRGAPHDRERAFVFSWRPPADPDRQGEPSRAVHAEVARLRATPVYLWNESVPTSAHGSVAHGTETRLARAIGLGVDQRTARDAGRILQGLLAELAHSLA